MTGDRNFDPWGPDQDSHCWITFMHQNWKIDCIHSLANISLVRQDEDGLLVYCGLDLSKMDNEAYCDKAVEWLEEMS